MSETIYEKLLQLQMLMHRAAFEHFGKAYNAHRGKGWVLALLNINPEINQKELTCLLNMSKQAAEELMNELEKSGYITREPSEEDKRVMTIRLTEEGAKAASNVDDTTSRISIVFDCLNDEEQVMFSEFLERIIKQQDEQFSNENFGPYHQMMKDFMLNDELSMGGHRAFPGFGFRPGMMGFNPGMKGFNSGVMGFNPGMKGFNSGMMGFNSGMKGFNSGMMGFNPGMKGFNPGAMGFSSGMKGFNPGVMNPHSFMSSPCLCHGHKQGC